MKGLTEKQQLILDFLETFSQTQGMAPTVYEIADHFQVKPATAFAHLRALQRKGYVNRSSKARSLSLMKPNAPRHMSLTLSIPVLGRISAGTPLLAEENQEKTIQFDPGLLPRGAGGHQLFGLRVNGESMRDAGILDGDIVIAKHVQSASIADLVVALVDDTETTVKYLYIDDSKVELRPANAQFKSEYYNPDQVKIQGVVVGLHRTYY